MIEIDKQTGQSQAPAGSSTGTASLNDEQRINIIRKAIRQKGDELRQQHPVLANQNLMGSLIFLFAISGIGLSAWAYLQGDLSPWLCIPLVAFFTSLLHELEHDLIHWQYFKNHKVIHHFMMLAVWLLRPGTINPWIRRHLHFLHHKTSGTDKDIEERGIGNGRDWGLMRLWIIFDTLTPNMIMAFLHAKKGQGLYRAVRVLLAYFPFGILTVAAWYSFWGFHGANAIAGLTGSVMLWSPATLENMAILNQLVVVLIAPYYVRSISINFISSNMHYYGNVNSIMQQTQVLTHPIFLPFQLFCFNFGSTHGIHHFVVKEPFYIRQLTAGVAHKVMREQGVRFNDLGTFARANRFDYQNEAQVEPVTAS